MPFEFGRILLERGRRTGDPRDVARSETIFQNISAEFELEVARSITATAVGRLARMPAGV